MVGTGRRTDGHPAERHAADGSPEIVAKSNPEIILMTEYGYDRLGSMEQAKTLPGVAETDAARHNRISTACPSMT